MNYIIYKDGQEINTIVAEPDFIEPYCAENGFTYAVRPDPAPVPEPEPETPDETSVWDELDAAYAAGYNEGYQEGVNTAYDNQ